MVAKSSSHHINPPYWKVICSFAAANLPTSAATDLSNGRVSGSRRNVLRRR